MRERPLWWIDGFIIGLPKGIHEFEVNKIRFVEDGDTSIFAFGEEVEVRGLGNSVNLIGVPNAVLQLYNWIFSKKGNRDVDLYIHTVLQPQKQLTVLSCFFLAQLFAHLLYIYNIWLRVQDVLSELVIFVVFVCGAELHHHVDLAVLDVVSVKVENCIFGWLVFKYEIPCFVRLNSFKVG